jgi:carbonic anhydrase
MMKRFFALSVATLLTMSLVASEHTTAHWSYKDDTGPAHWGDLSETFHMCKEGKNQSPIDLSGFLEAELPAISIDYKAVATDDLNNGHTVQVNFAKGSTFSVDGKTFTLKQYHFHTPSENRINGKSFPMEAHFVHADKDGNLAVIALMFKEGKVNSALQTILDNMPQNAGDEHNLSATKLNAISLLPENKEYYRFNGSLTTPPCSEGVLWIVMKHPVEASKAQLEAFSKVLGKNNRPVQPVNSRAILK